MATASPEPALDLGELVERPIVRIDGKDYELRHPSEFSLVAQLRLQKLNTRIYDLVAKLTADGAEPGTDAEEQNLLTMQDAICRQQLIADEAVFERLARRPDLQAAISRLFSTLQLEMNERTALQRAAAPATPEATTTAGKPSSHASAPATAAIPSAG